MGKIELIQRLQQQITAARESRSQGKLDIRDYEWFDGKLSGLQLALDFVKQLE